MTEQHSVHAAHLATESVHAAHGILEEVVRHRVEVVTAISLSVAALLTSWSAYQAAIWDGVESAQFTRAEFLRTEAATLTTRAGQLEGFDIFLFSQWLDAYATRNEPLQTFYQARFRGEFAPVFKAWVATQPLKNPTAPSSPFVMPQYKLAATAQSEAKERQAEEAFGRGEEARRHSNGFIQITVVLASAMFFGGIVQVFKMRHVRFFLMAVSLLTCLWGLIRVVALPIQ
ncbi:MAG TPA: hypothetical protein VN694_02725 [Caulobacteraceae bacterium]|nr:hypothetical protein [Caulobacteraceae bacterium]